MKVAAILLTAILCAWPGATLRGQEVIDRVLAVVVGDVITLSDVQAAQVLGLVDPGQARDPAREVLSKLIERALILDEAERYAPPSPPPEAIETALGAVRARFDSDQTFATTLARVGVSEQSLRQTLSEDLRIRAYLDQRFPVAAGTERRNSLIEAWVAGLRRRAEILDLYSSPAPVR